MSNRYSFGSIQPVPPLNDFLDIVLSRTQRKTPTVVHKGYAIGRIRDFYLRKVKFTGETFDGKLGAILEEFPRLDDIHPFYADLMNILYDKDHYKLALGQINTARHLIDMVSKEYSKLLKFGDSLYRCKQLKRAALGRMATIMKRQKDSLLYLEQVRQHLSRLPCIDPNTRTLLICGFPNVGKSSFMNKVTRADVDVQPYAFTTKSLFVGHMDFKYLRWQVIDTPGVLDHPLEDRNTIEMQSITALAHLRACVLYFVDVSQTCGFTIAQQVSLFSSIKPLFANKPILIVLNKVDLIRPDDMDQADKALLQTIMDEGFEFAQSSCVTDEGVMAVRNLACQKLMALRVEQKMKGQKIGDVLNRLHLASPQQRDEKARPAFIPDTVRARKGIPQDEEAPARRLMRNIELENGGAGVFNVNLKDNYLYKREEWKTDEIPEFLNGKNIADFIDPEIEERLLRLEAEEEALEASGAYDESRFELTPEESEMMTLANKIRQRKRVIQQENRLVGNTSSRPVLVSRIKRKRGLSRNEDGDDDEAHGKSMDIDMAEGPVKKVRAVSRSRGASAAPTRDRSVLGLRANDDGAMVRKVTQLKRIGEKQRNRDARRGEADRRILISRPAHLFSGKRGNGSTDRR
jgi:nucleolar GTP-binding protein